MARATLSVGTMNFGSRTDAAESRRIVDRALERGLTWFDTADGYNKGESERILGAALKGRRERAQIATKCGLYDGLGRAQVLAAIDQSLHRLGTDFVDLYYLHTPDPKTPFAETLDALATLLERGKVKAWGVSNFAAWQILELNQLCDARKLPRPAYSQVLYNLLVRQLDVEYFAFARRHPIHTQIYNPLAGGMLAGGKRGEGNARYQKRYWSPSLQRLAERLRDELPQVDLITLAYAWAAGAPGVDSILLGPGTLGHLDAGIDACAVELAPEVRAQADLIYRDFIGTDASYAR